MSVKAKGGEFLVGQVPGDGEHDPSVAGHSNGTFFVSWTGPYALGDEDGPRLYTEILGRAFDSGGALGGAFVVNTEQRDSQYSSDVTARADGSYIVTYSSGVEDQLPGTFHGHQSIGANGLKSRSEIYSPDYSYYHEQPDGSAFSDGSYVLVSAEEQNFECYVYGAAGNLEYTFGYGYRVGGYSSVTQLGDDQYLLVWSGLLADPEEGPYEDNPEYGLFGQVRTRAGLEVSTVLLADYSELGVDYPGSVESVTKVLGDGRIVTAFSLASESTSDSEVFVVTRNLDGQRSAAQAISLGKAGNQSAPDVAVLSDGRYVVAWQDSNGANLGDSDGTAIVARVFNLDGSADEPMFMVNTQTIGAQAAPSVAAIGTDFVVAWQGPDAIWARVFSSDTVALPDTHLLSRSGTQDGSVEGNQTLEGGMLPTSFYFDLRSPSGVDFVDVSSNDLIITNQALPDGDGDRIIHGARDAQAGTWLYDLDGSGPGSSAVTMANGGALRLLGTRTATMGETLFIYRSDTEFADNIVEGTLGKDTLHGTTANEKFFYDTALKAGLGQDQIKNFGQGDRLVTTTLLFDPNNDGRIRLNASDRLEFDTPAADGPSSLKIFNTNSKAVSTLVLEGSVVDGSGTHHYFYAAAGDPTLGSMHALTAMPEFLL